MIIIYHIQALRATRHICHMSRDIDDDDYYYYYYYLHLYTAKTKTGSSLAFRHGSCSRRKNTEQKRDMHFIKGTDCHT